MPTLKGRSPKPDGQTRMKRRVLLNRRGAVIRSDVWQLLVSGRWESMRDGGLPPAG